MKVEWARANVGIEHKIILDHVNKRFSTVMHWSRQFEYPWIVLNGDFKPGMKVLDAGGGHSPIQHLLAASGCQVVNMDLEPVTDRNRNFNVTQIQGDISKTNFPDGEFDKVVCVSVLEHCKNPNTIVRELLRVLKSNGQLLLTFDVASYARYNHTIDEFEALGLLNGLCPSMKSLPPKPSDILAQTFPEIDPKKNEPKSVDLNVLCAVVSKNG